MLLPLQGAGIITNESPGCRYALPRAMCLLPFQGAHIHEKNLPPKNAAMRLLPFQGAHIHEKKLATKERGYAPVAFSRRTHT